MLVRGGRRFNDPFDRSVWLSVLSSVQCTVHGSYIASHKGDLEK